MRKIFWISLFWLFFLGRSLFAGGPISVNDQGIAATWEVPSDIPYNPESGSCATFSNAEMLTKVASNIGHWSSIASILLGFSEQAGLIGSVDSSNYTNFIAVASNSPALSDGWNPVIFDDDGKIIADLFGSSNKFFVLGFAGPDGFNDDLSLINDGQALFNCFCLAGNPNDTTGACASAGVTFTEDDLNFTMMHEFGHFINLDHTQVNLAIVNAGCNTTSLGDCDDVPSMFPQSVDPAEQITPHRDDVVAALTLYGDGTLTSSFCAVSGSLEDKNGNALRCADVQAITNDPSGTIAVVSGAFAPAVDLNGDGFTDGGSECLSNCGDFVLRGLDANLSYTITVKPIDPSFIGGSSVGPCASGQLTGVVAEDIASISSCTAGSTTVLGTIKTQSSLENGDNGNGSSGTCGESQNFEDCPPLISCSFSRGLQAELAPVALAVFLAPLLFIGGARQYFLKRAASYDKNSSL